MIVDVQFTYTAIVTRPRRQKTEEAVYASKVSVEVREATSTEAPVAVTHVETWRRAGPRKVELRYFDGQLWAPVRDDEGELRRADAFAEDAQDPESSNGALRGSCPQPWRAGPRIEIERDRANLRQVHDESARTRQEEVIRARADGYLAVDGLMWTVAREPVLEVRLVSDLHGYVNVTDRPSNDPNHVFRLDQADDIRSILALPEDIDIKFPEFDVVIPEALRYRADERAVVAAAKMTLETMRSEVPDRDAAFFAAYAALRDEVASNPEKCDDPDWDVEPWVEKFEAAVAAVEAAGNNWWPETARETLARWRFRDRGADLDAIARM